MSAGRYSFHRRMPMITVPRLVPKWASPGLYDAIAAGRQWHDGHPVWLVLAGNLYTAGLDYFRAAWLAKGEP